MGRRSTAKGPMVPESRGHEDINSGMDNQSTTIIIALSLYVTEPSAVVVHKNPSLSDRSSPRDDMD